MKCLFVVLLAFMSIASAEHRAKRQGDPGPCRTCEQILNIAENHFHRNISDEAALLDQLHQECTRIGQTEGDAAKRDCLNIVDNNIDKIYSDLHAGKRPRQTCEDIGACKGAATSSTSSTRTTTTTTASTPRTSPPPSGVCPTGWIASSSVPNKCYLTAGASPDSWNVTLSKCQALNSRATLVGIRSSAENSEFAKFDQSSGYAWLGLYGNANNVWAWVDGQTVSYTNWAAGEPSTSQGCTKLKKQSGQWYSDDCTGSNDIACELYF